MTAPKPITLIDQCNQLRASMGKPPLDMRGERELIEEKACDEFAEDWVRGFGGLDEFNSRLEYIVEILRRDVDEIRPYSLVNLTDQWEYYGLGAADFKRLKDEIVGWINSYSALYGRFTILN